MSLSKTTFALLLASSLFYHQHSNATGSQQDAYQKGMALKKQGRYEQALKTWWQARTALEMQGTSDPRIGIAFIELATEQKLEKYYGTASDMYLWGFSRASVREFKKEIEAEVARILPLLEDEVQKKWQALVEQGSNKILPKIRQFWIEKDAMPTTPGNERLIEHWQRIAYARKNFIKNRLSVYGCDDRGLIYVKYGEPDNSIQRIVGSNLNEAMVWKELFTIPPGAKFNVMSVAMHQQPLFAGRIRDAIGFGECEVWAYGSINADDRVLFVFGNREGTGAYRLFDSIEDLINPRFFRGSGSMFGALLQLIYYNELAVFDSAFMKRYSELETRFSEAYSNAVRNNTTRFLARAFGSSFKAMHKKYQVSDKYDPLKKYADKNRSELDDLGNKIRLNTSMTRILDLQNQPTLVFIAFAIPSISNDLQNLENASYNLRYTLLIRDSSFAQIDRHATRQAPKANNTAFFTLPHESRQFHYTLIAEAISDNESQQLLGAGKSFFEAREPLDPDPNRLEISDLVIGLQPPANIDISALPFPLLPTKQIRQPDALTVYIEVYHLASDADGMSRFNLDFKVIRLEKKGDGFARKEVIASAFDYHSATRTAKEHFGIDISNLENGGYELVVEVQDMVSKSKKQRVERFEIRE